MSLIIILSTVTAMYVQEKQMFIRLGETKQMVFDDLDYYYVYTKKLDKTICDEVEQAMKNFHAGTNKVKAPFRKLLSVPVQLV